MSSSLPLETPEQFRTDLPNPAPTGDPTASAETSCWGRTWTWIMDNIIRPICDLFRRIFCCTCTERQTTPAPGGKPLRGLKPIISLDAPSEIATPIEDASLIRWPESDKINPQLKQVLTYLTISDEAGSLLITSSQTSTLHANAQKLQNHLSAIVQRLRSSTPMTQEHLDDLLTLCRRCMARFDLSSPISIFLNFCHLFKQNELAADVEPSIHPLIQICLPKRLDACAPEQPKAIHHDAIPTLGCFSAKQQFNLRKLLLLLAKSPVVNHWLTKAPPVVTLSSTGSQNISESITNKKGEIEEYYRDRLRSQISGILHILRNPSEGEVLNEDILITFSNLMTYCKMDLNNVKFNDILRVFSKFFEVPLEEYGVTLFKDSLLFLPDEMTTPLSRYPQALAQQVQLDQFPLETGTLDISEEQQSRLKSVLLLIAGMDQWDESLLNPLIYHPPVRKERDTDAIYLEKEFRAYTEYVKSYCLQQQLCLIVNKLRRQAADDLPKMSIQELKILVNLLKECGSSLEGNAFEIINTFTERISATDNLNWKTYVPLLWENVRTRFLHSDEPLPPTPDLSPTHPLINIGNSCYLNALLQMFANTDMLDVALSKELQQRNSFSAPNFEAKKALQSHLREIIRQMRQPGDYQALQANHLKILYSLLQINGWFKAAGTQQDPEELRLIIYEALEVDAKALSIVQLGEYSEQNINRAYRKERKAEFLQVCLPVDTNGSLPKEFDTIEKLIDFTSNDTIDDYSPPSGAPYCTLTTKNYLVGAAPKDLIVEFKRMAYNKTTKSESRLNVSLPVKPFLELPFYDASEIQDKPRIERYRLKFVINHHGSSANSGHYTGCALKDYDQGTWETFTGMNWQENTDSWKLGGYARGQKASQPLPLIEDTLVWVHYDDAAPPSGEISKDSEKIPQSTSKLLGPYAYCIAYELIPSEANEE